MMNKINPPDYTGCLFMNRGAETEYSVYPHEPAIPARSCITFRAGERIFDEGTAITGIYCIHSGHGIIIKRNTGEELVITMVQPGDILGIPDIIRGNYHQNGAVAIEDISACFIPMEEILGLLKKYPAIMLRIMQNVCERIRTMEQLARTMEQISSRRNTARSVRTG